MGYLLEARGDWIHYVSIKIDKAEERMGEVLYPNASSVWARTGEEMWLGNLITCDSISF